MLCSVKELSCRPAPPSSRAAVPARAFTVASSDPSASWLMDGSMRKAAGTSRIWQQDGTSPATPEQIKVRAEPDAARGSADSDITTERIWRLHTVWIASGVQYAGCLKHALWSHRAVHADCCSTCVLLPGPPSRAPVECLKRAGASSSPCCRSAKQDKVGPDCRLKAVFGVMARHSSSTLQRTPCIVVWTHNNYRGHAALASLRPKTNFLATQLPPSPQLQVPCHDRPDHQPTALQSQPSTLPPS